MRSASAPANGADAQLLAPFTQGSKDNPTYYGKYYYNNFEVVDMRPFRGRAHWDFFMTVEKDGSFMCPKGVAPGGKCKDGANGIGDADFRSMAVAAILRKREVHQFTNTQVKYRHPVPDWCDKA